MVQGGAVDEQEYDKPYQSSTFAMNGSSSDVHWDAIRSSTTQQDSAIFRGAEEAFLPRPSPSAAMTRRIPFLS